jgi:hypothetical protein
LPRLPFEVDVMPGEPADGLNQAAQEWCANLIVIGRGKRTNPWSLGPNIGQISLSFVMPGWSHTVPTC